MKINMLTHYMHIFVDICLQQLGILVYAAVGVRSAKFHALGDDICCHSFGDGCFFAVCFGFILEDPNESPMLCCYRMGKDSKVWALEKTT